jgi:hypothetical protein
MASALLALHHLFHKKLDLASTSCQGNQQTNQCKSLPDHNRSFFHDMMYYHLQTRCITLAIDKGKQFQSYRQTLQSSVQHEAVLLHSAPSKSWQLVALQHVSFFSEHSRGDPQSHNSPSSTNPFPQTGSPNS